MNPMTDPMPLSSRMSRLLDATRADLIEGVEPLTERFRTEHEVSADEAQSLAQHLSHAITTYRRVSAQAVLDAMGTELVEEAESSLRAVP